MALAIAIAAGFSSAGMAASGDVVIMSDPSSCSIYREHLDGSVVSSLVLRVAIGCLAGIDPSPAANGTAAYQVSAEVTVGNPGGIGFATPFGVTQLTFSSYDARPAISPDGSRIAFTRFYADSDPRAQRADIYLMNVDGSGLTRLTESDRVVNGVNQFTQNDYPSFSPDGSTLAYYCSAVARYYGLWCGPTALKTSRYSGLVLVRTDRTNRRLILLTDGRSPAWSPDGKLIAYERSSLNRPTQLGIVHSDGRDLSDGSLDLPDQPGFNARPTFSPDGGSLLFWSDRNSPSGNHFVMNPDGSDPTLLGVHGGGFARFIPPAVGGAPLPLVPPYVIVPALRGMTVAKARSRLARVTCTLGRVTRTSSSKIRKGRIAWQAPPAGEVAKPYCRVRVAISGGPGKRRH